MTRGNLPRDHTCYRLGDPEGRFAIFDDTGSRLFPGRWNTSSTPILYTSEHYANALLEKLVRFSSDMPRDQSFIEITVPAGASYEEFNPGEHRGWDRADPSIARAFGSRWQAERRSLALIVPSIPGGRLERNVLLNLQHPEAGQLLHSPPTPVLWDRRLFL
jgi:RES domain-containing protein